MADYSPKTLVLSKGGNNYTYEFASGCFYGTCSTAAATAAKVITVTGSSKFVLDVGVQIVVKFSETNSAQNPTFNVANTGAKSVWFNTAVITTGSLGYAGTANRPMVFVYDGTNFVFIGWSTDSNTTYSSMSAAEATTGTATTARTISAKVLNDKITEKIEDIETITTAQIDALFE